MTPLAILGVLGIICLVISVIVSIIKAFRCKHLWEFVDKTEFPPPIETAVKNGVNLIWGLNLYQREEMSKKTVVIVLRCPKCGESQILRETH